MILNEFMFSWLHDEKKTVSLINADVGTYECISTAILLVYH